MMSARYARDAKHGDVAGGDLDLNCALKHTLHARLLLQHISEGFVAIWLPNVLGSYSNVASRLIMTAGLELL